MMRTKPGTNTSARSLTAMLLFACASQAAFGPAPASAAPAGDPIDSVLVSVADANAVFSHEFTSSPVNSAPSEPEKALGNCGNAQAAAFADPWTAYRSVHYSTYNNLGPTQRVAMYADAAAAAQAFGKLTAQLATCKSAAPAPAAPAGQAPAGAAPSSPNVAAPADQSQAAQSAPAQPAEQSQAAQSPAAPAQQPAAQSFTVSASGADVAKWDDYVGFNQVSGMPYHCYREAHQHAAVVFEVETCDLDENGSLTSAMANKMLSQIPA